MVQSNLSSTSPQRLTEPVELTVFFFLDLVSLSLTSLMTLSSSASLVAMEVSVLSWFCVFCLFFQCSSPPAAATINNST